MISDSDISRSIVSASAMKVGEAVGMPCADENIRRWYIAIVNNNSERACQNRLEKRIEAQPVDRKDYETYVPVQKEIRVWKNGRRVVVHRIVLPSFLFIRCTEQVRLKEIVRLPFIKRFFVNIAGGTTDGHRPVAMISDSQISILKRMVSDADAPVVFDARPLRLGERVRVNGGKLVGLEGNVYREADGSTSLVVKIDILGCAKVIVPRDLLELVTKPSD